MKGKSTYRMSKIIISATFQFENIPKSSSIFSGNRINSQSGITPIMKPDDDRNIKTARIVYKVVIAISTIVDYLISNNNKSIKVDSLPSINVAGMLV